jgi:hypothetical protein
VATVLLPDALWTARPSSRLSYRHPVRAAKRDSMADAALRIGLRVRNDLLASSSTLARCRLWDLIHFAVLDWLARGELIDWPRAVVDSWSVRAVYGGPQTGPNPTDRAKRGSKRHLICDARGVPLAFRLTGANFARRIGARRCDSATAR